MKAAAALPWLMEMQVKLVLPGYSDHATTTCTKSSCHTVDPGENVCDGQEQAKAYIPDCHDAKRVTSIVDTVLA